jgi:hypothetical protein
MSDFLQPFIYLALKPEHPKRKILLGMIRLIKHRPQINLSTEPIPSWARCLLASTWQFQPVARSVIAISLQSLPQNPYHEFGYGTFEG